MSTTTDNFSNDPTGQTADRGNSWGLLPIVDPDYLVIERRPAWLHAYARGLLRHLHAIRAGGKKQGYPTTRVRAAAVWLIEAYAAAGIVPAPEAGHLIRDLVRPDPNASTSPVRRSSEEAYWAAIRFEAGRPPDRTGKQPSSATLYAVAKDIQPKLQNRDALQKTAEATVREWRRLTHYRDNVALQRRPPLE